MNYSTCHEEWNILIEYRIDKIFVPSQKFIQQHVLYKTVIEKNRNNYLACSGFIRACFCFSQMTMDLKKVQNIPLSIITIE